MKPRKFVLVVTVLLLSFACNLLSPNAPSESSENLSNFFLRLTKKAKYKLSEIQNDYFVIIEEYEKVIKKICRIMIPLKLRQQLRILIKQMTQLKPR